MKILSFIVAMAICSVALAQRTVVLSYSDGVPDTATPAVKVSPIKPISYNDRNGNGTWDQSTLSSYNEELFTWQPRQRLSIDGVEYVLEVVQSSDKRRTWFFWTHPDDVGLRPLTNWHLAGYPEPYLGYWDFNGRRFPAFIIYVQTSGQKYVTFTPWFRQTDYGGGTSTGQYDPSQPGWYGVCRLVDQAHGYPGNLFGYIGQVPNFLGWYSPDYFSGIFIFGDDWYSSLSTAIADRDRSHRVTSTDLFQFLECYFSGDLSADCSQDGVIGIDDIFVYLDSYLSCI